MTLAISRQLLALFAATAVVAGVAVARRADAPTGAAVAGSTARTATRAADVPAPVADVRLELLKRNASGPAVAARNPFQFKPKAAPAPPPSRTAGRATPVVIAPPAVPQGPPPPPPIALKYIGVLDTTQGRVAVFRDTPGDIVNGKEGDIIDGRYRLLKIGVESADLAYVDGRGRQTIRLSGQ
jgi:hypothetical protein